jgi:hypothetical protein
MGGWLCVVARRDALRSLSQNVGSTSAASPERCLLAIALFESASLRPPSAMVRATPGPL